MLSGGHSQILIANGVGNYQLLGGTLDDSAGEAFDKVARVLGILKESSEKQMHAGELLEHYAMEGSKEGGDYIQFPIPMRGKKNCDFSFSGLKTAVVRYSQTLAEIDSEEKKKIAAGFQHSAVEHIHDRLKRAIQYCKSNVIDIDNGDGSNDDILNQVVRKRQK